MKKLILAALLVIPAFVSGQTQFSPGIPSLWTLNGLSAQQTVDAAGEASGVIGTLALKAGTGTKTCSAAGTCHIITYFLSTTFVTASSEVRVGLEDVASTGLGDTTQDVFGAKVAGTNTLPDAEYVDWDMTSGTKTVSHGDRLAITLRMPVRAGADTMEVGKFIPGLMSSSANTATNSRPYGQSNTSKSQEMLYALIVFDDGTTGWIRGQWLVVNRPVTQIAINTGTTPDEVVGGFTVPSPILICGLQVMVDDVGTADDYEVNLYGDPFGTISNILINPVDAESDTLTSASVTVTTITITPLQLTTSQTGGYGIGLRPTTANNISASYEDLGSGFQILKQNIPFFSNVKYGERVNNTGAFTETQTYFVPFVGIVPCGFMSGAGGSSAY